MKIPKGACRSLSALTGATDLFYSNTPLLVHSGMSQSPRTTDTEGIDPAETTIPVSRELRDKIRLEKTRQDVNYDQFLRENLPIEA